MNKTSRYVALVGLTLSSSLPAATTAWWRLEEGANGNSVAAAVDSSGNGFGQSSSVGDPKYSNNVPGAFIFDPVSGITSPNTLSLDASVANSRVRTVNNAAFNTSFTLEMFIQLTGEPGGYHNFARRQQSSTHIAGRLISIMLPRVLSGGEGPAWIHRTAIIQTLSSVQPEEALCRGQTAFGWTLRPVMETLPVMLVALIGRPRETELMTIPTGATLPLP